VLCAPQQFAVKRFGVEDEVHARLRRAAPRQR
jgi:hypothetical protein